MRDFCCEMEGWTPNCRSVSLYQGCVRTQQQVTLIDLSAGRAECWSSSIWVHKCNLTASITTALWQEINVHHMAGTGCARMHAWAPTYACKEVHTTRFYPRSSYLPRFFSFVFSPTALWTVSCRLYTWLFALTCVVLLLRRWVRRLRWSLK